MKPLTAPDAAEACLEAFNNIPAIKCGGDSKVWGCLAASGIVVLKKVHGMMDYIQILQKKRASLAVRFGLGHAWVFQQDNDVKHRSAVKEWPH